MAKCNGRPPIPPALFVRSSVSFNVSENSLPRNAAGPVAGRIAGISIGSAASATAAALASTTATKYAAKERMDISFAVELDCIVWRFPSTGVPDSAGLGFHRRSPATGRSDRRCRNSCPSSTARRDATENRVPKHRSRRSIRQAADSIHRRCAFASGVAGPG